MKKLAYAVIFLSCVLTATTFAAEHIPEAAEEYAKYFKFDGNRVLFKAPFVGAKNDKDLVYETELLGGDYIRFSVTLVEQAEIIKVLKLEKDYAVMEYLYASSPPAPREYKRLEFKIYKEPEQE